MTQNYDWLTAKEHFSMFGTVPASRLEQLVENNYVLDVVRGELGDIDFDEMSAGFPEEDFMDVIIFKMNELKSNLRGKNREEMGYIIKMVEEMSRSVARSAEYGADCIRKAEEKIDAVLR